MATRADAALTCHSITHTVMFSQRFPRSLFSLFDWTPPPLTACVSPRLFSSSLPLPPPPSPILTRPTPPAETCLCSQLCPITSVPFLSYQRRILQLKAQSFRFNHSGKHTTTDINICNINLHKLFYSSADYVCLDRETAQKRKKKKKRNKIKHKR